jgi:hypothetical protein
MDKKHSPKKHHTLVIIAIAIIIIILSGFLLYKFPIQNIFPIAKPKPIADVVTLSPKNQTAPINILSPNIPSAWFNVTITKGKGNHLLFPCSINLITQPTSKYVSGSMITIKNYGTYPMSTTIYSATSNPETIYAAVVQDAKGANITSNNVTVYFMNIL